MLDPVPRTCTFKPDDFNSESHEIAFFRETDAYVLLGDPGAGKTTLFKQEAKDSNGLYISARDFIAFNKANEWQGKMLFIDGLDETRAGKGDARTPLDAIRGKLHQLGCSRFRLSCREADWLGGNDLTALNTCAANGKVTVLHLNALTDDDVKIILKKDRRVDNEDVFMQKARQFTLDGMLHNPQTLDMLIAAVQGDKWPNTKLETYNLACQKMAVEHSDEHKAGNKQQSTPVDQLLEAAGFLCATLLLANASTFNENEDVGDDSVDLNTIKIPDDLPCAQILESRLFKCTNGELCAPIHRSVAEFMGARFLANKIKEGLPLGRVLALITGFDGGVVAALRGLTSWLCAHSIDARNHLIEIDPLGVVLYGDAQLFSTQTKQQLLSALRNETKNHGYLRYDHFASYGFSALTTQDMASQLLDLLTNSSREEYDQQVLNCVLHGLQYSTDRIPELKDALLLIVRDKTYWEGIRVGGLQAFIHQYPDDVNSLLVLAEDFRKDKFEDIKDRLLSILLKELFPKIISADEILKYLKPTEHKRYSIRGFNDFWDYSLIKLIKNEDVPILLDEITKYGDNAFRQSQDSDWFRLIGKLLVRGVENFGENISDGRLYDWLSLGLDEYQYHKLENKYIDKIQQWLKNHPKSYLSLISEGLNRITETEKMNHEIHKVLARIYNAAPPDDLGLWWLNRALEVDSEIKGNYFTKAWWLLINRRGHKGLSMEFFDNWVEQHPEFKDIYQSSLVCDIDDDRNNYAQSKKNWTLVRKKEKVDRLTYIRKNRVAIQDGSVHTHVLHVLASAYFDHYSSIRGETGNERLAEFLDHDEELISIVKKGMRKVFDRTDLPKNSEIFSLAAEHREHYIRLPFLTCMDEFYQEDPAMLDSLSDDLATKALAFWYTYGAGNEPAWVKPLSFSRPVLTANILTEYVSAMLAAKQQYIHGVYQLQHNPEYHEIAKLAAIPLLKIYPVRANKQQALTLENLLKAAIEYCDRNELLELIAEKLKLKSLDVAQHVYWLAAGLIVAPAQYESMIRKYVGDNVTRINYLSAFLYSGFHSGQSSFPLPLNIIGYIVELLAPRATPYWPEREDSAVTRSMHDGDYVRALLNRLSENPDIESAQIIEHLLTLPQLTTWHEMLRNIRKTQQISRREALFHYPSAAAVALTLNNLKPANVADLAALALDHLKKLSDEMRASNMDSYKNFWNDMSNHKPDKPRTENNCRDYIAERLRLMLSVLDVDVQRETWKANNKRADICLSFSSNGNAYHLPFEVKLDHSGSLWKAIHEQLIPRYTLDPETQGRGIFLVIWFGEKTMPPPPSGKKPKTAIELQARLIETLTPQEKKLIDVFVLDVSKP